MQLASLLIILGAGFCFSAWSKNPVSLDQDNIESNVPVGVNVNEIYTAFQQITENADNLKGSAIAISKDNRAGVRYVYGFDTDDLAINRVLVECRTLYGPCELYSQGGKIVYAGRRSVESRKVTLVERSRSVFCATKETVYRVSRARCVNKYLGSPYVNREQAIKMKALQFGAKVETESVFCVTQLGVLNTTRRGCEEWYSGEYYLTEDAARQALEQSKLAEHKELDSNLLYCATRLGVVKTTLKGCNEWYTGAAFKTRAEANIKYRELKPKSKTLAKAKTVTRKKAREKEAPWDGVSPVKKPYMFDGDTWTYRGYSYKVHQDVYTHTVNRDGFQYLPFSYKAKKQDVNRVFNTGKHGLDAFSPVFIHLEFPLTVGKRWNQTRVGDSIDGYKYNYKNEYKVLKIEDKTVEAGKFKALKIRIRSKIIEAPGHTGIEYVWYAPDVKRIILAKPSWRKGVEMISYDIAD